MMQTPACQEIESQLEAYVLGESQEARCLAIRAHLDTCPSCAKIERSIRKLIDAIRADPLPPASPGLATTVTNLARTRIARGEPVVPTRSGGPMSTRLTCPNCGAVQGANAAKCDYCRMYLAGARSAVPPWAPLWPIVACVSCVLLGCLGTYTLLRPASSGARPPAVQVAGSRDAASSEQTGPVPSVARSVAPSVTDGFGPWSAWKDSPYRDSWAPDPSMCDLWNVRDGVVTSKHGWMMLWHRSPVPGDLEVTFEARTVPPDYKGIQLVAHAGLEAHNNSSVWPWNFQGFHWVYCMDPNALYATLSRSGDLASTREKIDPQRWHQFRCRLVKSTQILWVDGKEHVRQTHPFPIDDAEHQRLGLRFHSKAQIKNLTVTRLAVTPR